MIPVQLTVFRSAPEVFKIRAEFADRVADASPSAPPDGLLEDLGAQISAGGAREAATTVLSDALGKILFDGEAGALLREALADEPQRPVLLATDATLARLPWELARDPQTGRAPVADGAGFVRVGGAPTAAAEYSPRAVLVIPEARGEARVDALTSATRRLGRKAQLDIFPAEPPTGPALRRELGAGAALVHLDADTRGGRISLDDGAVPVERLSLDARTWMVVLGGAETTKDAAYTLRDAGVPVVLGRQMELQPHELGAIDRELYRALAGGVSPLEALRRVRRALIRLGGMAGGIWASPVLWTAPPRPEDGDTPALDAFPPLLRTAGAFDLSAATTPARQPASAGARPTPPVPAAVFVQQTIRMLRDAAPDTADSDLVARAAALRAIGSAAASDADDEAALAPDERIDRMVDRFISALGHADFPLSAPGELTERVQSAAARCAVAPDDLATAATALLAAPAIWLDPADGAAAGEAAIALSRDVFDALPRVIDGADTAPLIGTPGGDDGTGWLYGTALLNWRRDEVDAFEPEQPDPQTRMPVLTRSAEGWRTYRGVWLVVEAAQVADPGTVAALLRALDRGVLEGLSADGRAWRLPLPSDLRVIFTGPAPVDLPPALPVVRLGTHTAAAEVERWLQRADTRLGVAADPEEAADRRRLAEHLAAIVRFCRVFTPVPPRVGEATLLFALQHRAEGDAAVDRAASLFLSRPIAALPPRAQSMLAAWFDGQPGQVLSQAVAHSAELPIDHGLVRRLAAHLDTDFPQPEPRVEAAGKLAALDAGRLVLRLRGWVGQGGLSCPVPCPRLRGALSDL